MARRPFAFLLLFLLASLCPAQESYLGLYFQDQKLGYALSSIEDDVVAGKPMKKFTSKTVMNAGLLGTAMSVTIEQTSWSTPEGKPSLVKFMMASGGRSQLVEANYLANGVHLAIDNNGAKTTKLLPIPKDAPIVDDALTALLEGTAVIGKSQSFYVLDPMTSSFVKNTVTLHGKKEIDDNGKKVLATHIEVAEPRMKMQCYLTEKGDLVRAEALGGIVMRPVSKEEALAANPSGGFADLAEMTKMPVSPPLGDPAFLRSATYRFSGGNMERAPVDGRQHIAKSGANWVVKVGTLPAPPAKPITIAQAAAAQPAWVKTDLNIPTADVAVALQARSIIGNEKNAVAAARKIGRHVHSIMSPNSGIGVLRDAREVLRTKEGVCRDYAILTASLLRSAKIPARLASGLVYYKDAFYYHAWVESWDGRQWYGIDSTRPNLDVTVGHIKLAQGNVADAFLFTFLDRAKVTVVEKLPK